MFGQRHVATLCLMVVAAGGVAGCSWDAPGGQAPPGRADAVEWFPACPSPVNSPDSAGSPSGPDGANSQPPAGGPTPVVDTSPLVARRMPSVSLECLGGQQRVDVGAPLGTPVVMNVWASWCEPCRKELPAFQEFADRAAGQVAVLGVVTQDTYAAATAFAKDLKIRFPGLYDRRGALMKSLGRAALPLTLFVDADGSLAHVHNGEPLTEHALRRLADKHLLAKP